MTAIVSPLDRLTREVALELHVDGDIPISTDGRPSVLIEGAPKPESTRTLEFDTAGFPEVVSS
jgi:hypothetical protein